MNREQQQTRALSTEVAAEGRKKSLLLSALAEGYRRRLKKNGELLLDLLFGVFACFFAQTHAAFGVYPFSLALLLATSGRPLPVFVGAGVGCYFLGEAGGLYLILHTAALLLRILFSRPSPKRRMTSDAYFGEAPVLRTVSAAALGISMALYELIFFGMKTYTLLFAAGAVFLLPAVTLLFCFVTVQAVTPSALFGKAKEGVRPWRPAFGGKSAFLLEVGGVFLFFTVALSLSSFSLFGISLGKCAIAALTLFVARRFGAARGCVAGLLIGLAEEIVYLPAFGLLGLLSGLYVSIGMPCALAAAVLAGGGYAAYVGGVSGFLSVAPEMTVSALLLWAPLRAVPGADKSFFHPAVTPPSSSDAPPPPSTEEQDAEGETLACLSGAFSTVSETLKQAAAEEKTPSPEEFESLCMGAKEKLCRRCPAEGACQESDAVMAALHAAVIRLSIGEGVSETVEAPCEGYPGMVEEIRRGTADLSRKKRLGGAKGALSTDYALLSEILREAKEARLAERARDEGAEAALADALRAEKICARRIRVIGKRQRQVFLEELSLEGEGTVDGDRVRAACVRVLGAALGEVNFIYDGNTLSATVESRRAYLAEGGAYTLSGSDGETSGDRAVYLESENGMAYALLCDGMGSGTRAARAAEMGVSVLSSLLAASVRKETALALLNNVICSSEEECSLALDLLSIDLYEGRASFLKSGAAASFVHRENALFRIRSRTIPLGLLRIVDSEEAGFDIRIGDRMILLSDGVLGAYEDGSFLKDILRTAPAQDCRTLARAIVEGAVKRDGRRDDMTAVVIEIK